MKNLRVLFITEWYPPYTLGGAGVYAYELTQELSRLGVEVHIVCPASISGKQSEGNLFIHRFKTYRLPFISLPFFIYKYSKGISKLIKQYDIDLVHSNGHVGFAVSSEIPLVSTAHHLIVDEYLKTRGVIRRFKLRAMISWEKRVFESSEKIMCQSDYTKKTIERYYPPFGEKCVVIPNGVNILEYCKADESIIERLKEVYALGNDKKVIFLPGGARIERKGAHYLIKAIPQMISENKDVIVAISGKGWERYLSKLVKKTGVAEHVCFLGELSEDELVAMYRLSSIVVYPSLLEGFGLVPLEAMAAQTPVIASDVGGLSNVIQDGVDGLLTTPGNPDDIARKINLVLEDDTLRLDLIKNGWKKAQKYRWENTAKKTLETYVEVLSCETTLRLGHRS